MRSEIEHEYVDLPNIIAQITFDEWLSQPGTKKSCLIGVPPVLRTNNINCFPESVRYAGRFIIVSIEGLTPGSRGQGVCFYCG